MDSIQLSNDEERTMLRDSIRGLLSEHWPPEKAQAYAADPERQKSMWRLLSEQGLSALCSKDSGTGLREALIVMAELGRAACPAPVLDAALLNLFIGHDSGISHIAAAAGARCLLLFGWTDPAIWAPANEKVRVLRAPGGKMERLEIATVLSKVS